LVSRCKAIAVIVQKATAFTCQASAFHIASIHNRHVTSRAVNDRRHSGGSPLITVMPSRANGRSRRQKFLSRKAFLTRSFSRRRCPETTQYTGTPPTNSAAANVTTMTSHRLVFMCSQPSISVSAAPVRTLADTGQCHSSRLCG
jgi:hypothetical protein